jgi:putative peptide zinc metalloprotease protein
LGIGTDTENTTPPIATATANRGPVLADGVELIGEYEGSGYKEPPKLVRRADGQTIQLPDLLYQVAALSDGRRTYEEVADELSEAVQRKVDADDVRFLVAEKLRPIGILAGADGSSPPVERADPFLGFKVRIGVISECTSRRLGTLFKLLFLPPIVLASLVGLALADIWLFFGHGVAQALRQSIMNPALFLLLFAGIVASAAFHEIGHAAACRYGGGQPGKMGCGLYLAWPAFYTDVTDAYRLDRRARLRTDLGGVYFNVLIILAATGGYLATGFEPLLLLVVVQHFEIAHQLLPIVRLDGYYIVADLTGVPDLFARIGPILSSVVPGRELDERVTVLKPWVRRAVTVWVVVVVPLLAFELLMVLIHLPRLLGTAWSSGSDQINAASSAFGRGDAFNGVSSVLQGLLLAIPMIGILLVLKRSLHSGGSWVWRNTEGKPVLRTMSAVLGLGCAALLAMAWIPRDNYRPIRPNERGTVTDAIKGIRQVATHRRLDGATAPQPATAPRVARTPAPAPARTGPTTTLSSAPKNNLPPVTTTLPTHVTTTVNRSAPSTTRAPSPSTTLVRSPTTTVP